MNKIEYKRKERRGRFGHLLVSQLVNHLFINSLFVTFMSKSVMFGARVYAKFV